MTKDHYVKAVTQRFPHLNIDKMDHIAIPELVKMVAIEFFLENDPRTPDILQNETRRQLRSLQRNGVHAFNAIKRELKRVHPDDENGDEIYASHDGYTLKREYTTLSPNGNTFNGRWVLRDGDGELVGFNTYRSDLSEHYNFIIK